jgi:hypothetical protein
LNRTFTEAAPESFAPRQFLSIPPGEFYEVSLIDLLFKLWRLDFIWYLEFELM